MARVLLYVPDCHVLEHTEVCAHGVVSMGLNLPSSTAHAPHPAVVQPRFVLWEEVPGHALKPRRSHDLRNLLVPHPSLWHCQVGVKIADH